MPLVPSKSLRLRMLLLSGSALPFILTAPALAQSVSPIVSAAPPPAGIISTSAGASGQPSGGRVVDGRATITQSGDGHTRIDQASDRAIINWDDFSIGADRSVRFFQPDVNSIALNRVTGGNVSDILGELSGNGRIFLINRNGVVFGKSARVDTAGLVVSTADLDDCAFMTGNHFAFDAPGSADAMIVNQGSINIRDAGVAAFVAPHVRNQGIIRARLGQVTLAGAQSFTLDMAGDNLFRFQIGEAVAQGTDGAAASALVESSGVIDAQGGSVLLTARAARDVVNGSVRVSDARAATGVSRDAQGAVVLGAPSPTITASRLTIDGDGPVEVDRSAHLDLAGGDLTVRGSSLLLSGRATLDGTVRGGRALFESSGWLSFGMDLSANGRDAGGSVTLRGGAMSLAGQIYATAQTGRGGTIDIHATGRAIDTVDFAAQANGLHGGAIRYTSDQQVISSGLFSASASYGFGGTVDITAPVVNLFGSRLFAIGGIAGGRVRVGGEYQGGRGAATDELANARFLTATDNTLIDVSAYGLRGRGGDAVVWSDEETTWYGTTRSMGGLQAGNGGLIEVSGAKTLHWDGTVETARNGQRGGTLLLDPRDINIVDVQAATGTTQYDLILQAFGDFYYSDRHEQVVETGDEFGVSVSLDGNRLAVGAPRDDGAGVDWTTGNEAGAVHLFTFADANFSNPLLAATIGSGYTGGSNVDVTLQAGDQFGYAVALDGNRLAVGAPRRNSEAFGQADSGAVYLFSFADAAFSGGLLRSRIADFDSAAIGANGFGANDFDIGRTGAGRPFIRANDAFGSAVALDGNRLAVGAPGHDGAENNISNGGSVFLFDFDCPSSEHLAQLAA